MIWGMQVVRVACSMQTQVYYGDVQPVAALLSELSVRDDARCGTAYWACRRCCFKQVLCVMLTLPLTRPVNVLTKGQRRGASKVHRRPLWSIRRWRAIWPKQIPACAFAKAHTLSQPCNDHGSIVSTVIELDALQLLSRWRIERAVTEAV